MKKHRALVTLLFSFVLLESCSPSGGDWDFDWNPYEPSAREYIGLCSTFSENTVHFVDGDSLDVHLTAYAYEIREGESSHIPLAGFAVVVSFDDTLLGTLTLPHGLPPYLTDYNGTIQLQYRTFGRSGEVTICATGGSASDTLLLSLVTFDTNFVTLSLEFNPDTIEIEPRAFASANLTLAAVQSGFPVFGHRFRATALSSAYGAPQAEVNFNRTDSSGRSEAQVDLGRQNLWLPVTYYYRIAMAQMADTASITILPRD